MQVFAFSGFLQFATPMMPATNSATALTSASAQEAYRMPEDSSPSLMYAKVATPRIATIARIRASAPPMIMRIPVTFRKPEPFAVSCIVKSPFKKYLKRISVSFVRCSVCA